MKPCAVARGAGIALVLVLGIVLGGGSARADAYGLTVSAFASACPAYNQCNTQQFNTGALPVKSITLNPMTASFTTSFPTGMASTYAGTQGTVTYGAASGTVFVESTAYCASPPGSNCFNTVASGVFQGFWNDTLTITSKTLPLGSQVNLMATMSIHADIYCTSVNASVQALGAFTVVPGTVGGVPPIILSSNLCNSLFQESQRETFTAFVGESVLVGGQLSLLASAYALNGQPSVVAVDPPASGFFIDSLTPGASYVTASGHSYSSTPEPGTLVLLGSGMPTLFYVVRRRRRSTSPTGRQFPIQGAGARYIS